MANPQTENGYTKIANEIMDNLILNNLLSGQELRFALLVIRKTYGFSKKEDVISLSQMQKATRLGKIRCSQIINSLQLMKIVTVTENINGIGKKYIFNKDFEQWATVKENINRYRKTKATVNVLRSRPLMKTLTTKETITKETITKEKGYFDFEEIWKEYPNKDGKKEALRHFKATVKTETDFLNIKKAIINYLQSEKVKKGFVKNGSTWFNNWQDWIEVSEIKSPSSKKYCVYDQTRVRICTEDCSGCSEALNTKVKG